MLKVLVTYIAFGLGLSSFSTESRANEFTAVAAGCMPDPVNIQANDYLVTSGSVKHQTGVTNTIHMRCPISIVITKPTHIYLTYYDDYQCHIPGCNNHTFVTARLDNTSITTDAPGTQYCAASSNSGTQDGSVHKIDVVCSGLPATWDQSNYSWYLDITITRGNTSNIAIFYGAGVY